MKKTKGLLDICGERGSVQPLHISNQMPIRSFARSYESQLQDPLILGEHKNWLRLA